MEILLGILAVMWMGKYVITHVAYARRGEMPPRTRERLASIEHDRPVPRRAPIGPRSRRERRERRQFGSPDREQRYGFRDLLADGYFDGCERVRARQVQRRVEKADRPDRGEQIDRVERWPQRFGWFAAAARNTGRLLWEPVGETSPGTRSSTARPEPSVDSGPASLNPPEVGTRFGGGADGRVLEWDGDAWAPVCSHCGTPMDAHDARGWLTCGICGRRAVDDAPVREGATIHPSQFRRRGQPLAEDPDHIRNDEPSEGSAITTTPTGGSMDITGDALTVEQTRANLTSLDTYAQANVDKAGAAAAEAQAASTAVELMANNMAAQHAHPDTIGDMADVLEQAKAVEGLAGQLAAAAADMQAKVDATASGVNQRDGLVAEVGASTGNVAERSYLEN